MAGGDIAEHQLRLGVVVRAPVGAALAQPRRIGIGQLDRRQIQAIEGVAQLAGRREQHPAHAGSVQPLGQMHDHRARIAGGTGREIADLHQRLARHRPAQRRGHRGFGGHIQILFDEQRRIAAVAQPDHRAQRTGVVAPGQQLRHEYGQPRAIAGAIDLGDEGFSGGATRVADGDRRIVGAQRAVAGTQGRKRRGEDHAQRCWRRTIKRR